jgi:hypothetical protein
MAVTVRPADPEAGREVLIGVLERNLPELAHRVRFKWLYEENPAGRAWSWQAYEGKTDEVVGVASVFPRAVWVDARIERCGQVGDFAVDATHRSLGPAMMLQRATFEPVRQEELLFCYDCPPHERGLATLRRLGLETTCRTRHYVRLLKSERQIERRLGRGRVAAAVAGLANGALNRCVLRSPSEPGLETAEHAGRFDEEFTELDREAGGADIVRSRRGAPDLNWRYRDDPLREYRVLTARRRGELVAFLVLSVVGEEGWINDVGGRLSPGVSAALLDAAVKTARAAGVHAVRTVIGEGQQLSVALRRTGFWPRDPGPRVVAAARQGTRVASLLARPSNWWIRLADVLA